MTFKVLLRSRRILITLDKDKRIESMRKRSLKRGEKINMKSIKSEKKRKGKKNKKGKSPN